ncbi:MAG: hypothetical protein RBS57_16315, partial [Desulforhabdus sp.]|nr:hypothetical protein [Desulforhabdus sp.]
GCSAGHTEVAAALGATRDALEVGQKSVNIFNVHRLPRVYPRSSEAVIFPFCCFAAPNSWLFHTELNVGKMRYARSLSSANQLVAASSHKRKMLMVFGRPDQRAPLLLERKMSLVFIPDGTASSQLAYIIESYPVQMP